MKFWLWVSKHSYSVWNYLQFMEHNYITYFKYHINRYFRYSDDLFITMLYQISV